MNVICSGVELAAETAGNRALTALSLGPVGSALKLEMNCYEELAKAVRGFPLDFILLETCTDHEESRSAVKSFARYFSMESIVVSHYPGEGMSDIVSLAETKKMFSGAIPGINCIPPNKSSLELYSLLLEKCGQRVYFSPNAGAPGSLMPPSDFSAFAVDLQPWMFGGCCGTDPSYIRMISSHI